ncbi:uncharacterized protein MAM_06628 [Metarhizium album ARSEF 1941]|uniref:Uncharacterized protein n=1 Tax=Metarhizium album (strain ARSEF 1941) TaxID=1081103 RepID=A0A0B2WHR7_METAS|nr:uncharacterized protein MAM_06628 [Metarhizium album ARSEF 1941]KHN95571.1 hypothetical protein MAM_06628 [Metarhizium album ARSEF 1941]
MFTLKVSLPLFLTHSDSVQQTILAARRQETGGTNHRADLREKSPLNFASTASSSQQPSVPAALTAEQEAAFRVWAEFQNNGPSLQQSANEYLESKYSLATGADFGFRATYGPPVSFLPEHDAHFSILVGDQDSGWKAATLLIRELCMLKGITDKPEWWRKVRDPAISARWKDEMLAVNGPEYHAHADFTPRMADACTEELTDKADLYEATGLIPVLDYSACVVKLLKSDSLMDQQLTKQLMDAARPLEDAPEQQKDWHPGSNEKVLDLVHPSLWPLVYGRSRILPDKEITVDNCLDHMGTGEVIARPDMESDGLPASTSTGWASEPVSASSVRYQCLPCNVVADDKGEAKINSYIDSLHPIDHAALYAIIEKFISESLPAWDLAGAQCTTPEACKDTGECRPTNRPVNDDEPPREEHEEYGDGYQESERGRLDALWFQATHPQMLPDATSASDPREEMATKTEFERARRQQERFSAMADDIKTALFYHDNENITESRLAFRTSSNSEDLTVNLEYTQNDVRSVARTFAVDEAHEATTLQNIGSVLTRQARAVFFRNLSQHQVQPFSLEDPTRPGHGKILALFLVDPAIPVISTANVPPQQRHWRPAAEYMRRGSRLQPELANTVSKNVDSVIGGDEARDIQKRLMAERTVRQEELSNALQSVRFSFCEH